MRMSAERVISARLRLRECTTVTVASPSFAFLHEKKCQRLADDHAPAEHDDMRAGDFDAAFDEQTLTA